MKHKTEYPKFIYHRASGRKLLVNSATEHQAAGEGWGESPNPSGNGPDSEDLPPTPAVVEDLPPTPAVVAETGEDPDAAARFEAHLQAIAARKRGKK